MDSINTIIFPLRGYVTYIPVSIVFPPHFFCLSMSAFLSLLPRLFGVLSQIHRQVNESHSNGQNRVYIFQQLFLLLLFCRTLALCFFRLVIYLKANKWIKDPLLFYLCVAYASVLCCFFWVPSLCPSMWILLRFPYFHFYIDREKVEWTLVVDWRWLTVSIRPWSCIDIVGHWMHIWQQNFRLVQFICSHTNPNKCGLTS